MNGPRVVSARVPYVPIVVSTRLSRRSLATTEALIDTGFDGHVVVPSGTFTNAGSPHRYLSWTLADGSSITAPAYRGELEIGTTRLAPVVISELGDEPIIGLRVLQAFTLTLDHGRTLTIEP